MTRTINYGIPTNPNHNIYMLIKVHIINGID